MNAAVEARQLSVTLGGSRVVDDLALTVEPGEWLAVIGPNGAGKTTLLRALAGLVAASGTIRLQGRSESLTGRRERARLVALVPQLPQTPPALTVAEYVLLGRTPHIAYLGGERHADRVAAARAINRLALDAFVQRSLGSLSGGERQRVVLARALAQAAPILLLDEPTSALDLGRQQEALELVDELRRQDGLAVISAMHDLSLAGQYADRLLLLNRGRIVAGGSPDQVLTEATIAGCYGADVRVLHEAGAVYVLPRRGQASR
ncbi:MAG: ABC transporter ATP-binding protein [Solirubrobacteraceae bacterium]